MLALLLASAVQAPFVLALNARPGDAWTVEARERFHNAVEEFDETDVWREEYRVVSATGSGTHVAFTRTFLHTELEGAKIPPAKGNTPATGEAHLRPVGGTMPYGDSEQPIPLVRVERFESQGVFYPEGEVRVGARWSLALPRQGPVPEAKLAWWLLRVEEVGKRRCAVVGLEFAEDPAFDYPMTAKGERTVDIATGIVLEERVTTSNYPIPGGTFRVDRTMERRLLEAKFGSRLTHAAAPAVPLR